MARGIRRSFGLDNRNGLAQMATRTAVTSRGSKAAFRAATVFACAVASTLALCSSVGPFLPTANAASVLDSNVSPLTIGIDWTSRAAADNSWQSVAYGNGLFVAVSSGGVTSGQIMTSPDGITWTPRTSAAASSWTSVTYGDGLFVAVASSSSSGAARVMTSPDGVSWTARTTGVPDGCIWKGVTHGNNLFVAVAVYCSTQRVMTSPDGINWTGRASGVAANTWSKVTYGNGTFVAVAESGAPSQAMTSTNGIDWTARTTPSVGSPAAGSYWTGITYGNNLFVAVAGSETNRVMTSPDGATWTAQTPAEVTNWSSVTYGNGLFVAVAGGGTNRVMTSTNGASWTPQTAAAANSWTGVTYGGGMFVAVASTGTGNRVMTSGTFTAAPGAPPIPTAVAGPNAATVTVSAGSGGAPASYVVTAVEDNSKSCTVTGAAGSCEISGLTNGTSYSFTATATNISGTSAPSLGSNSVTPAAAPDAPTSLDATPGDGSASIAFTLGSDNGAAITNIDYSTDDGATWRTRLGPATSPLAITGLTNGTTYQVKLRAINSVGNGSASSAVSVTPAATPTPTPTPTPDRSNKFVTLPVDATNSALQSTLVVSDPGVATQKGTFIYSSGARSARRLAACTGSRKITKAGRYKINCTLTAGARSARRRSSIRVTLTTTFTPTGGTARSVTRTVTLKKTSSGVTG